jgi:hypothetical protein
MFDDDFLVAFSTERNNARQSGEEEPLDSGGELLWE